MGSSVTTMASLCVTTMGALCVTIMAALCVTTMGRSVTTMAARSVARRFLGEPFAGQPRLHAFDLAILGHADMGAKVHDT